MEKEDKIIKSIKEYVKEEFSSSPLEYDLLQDEKIIKRVFDKDNNMLLGLSEKIGKIGLLSGYKTSVKDPVVCQMFDLKAQEFYEYFVDLFYEQNQRLTIENDTDYLVENSKYFQSPIRTYLYKTNYRASFQLIEEKIPNCDYCDDEDNNNDDHYDDINSTKNLLQKHPFFIKNDFLRKYKQFGALNPTFALLDIEYGRIFVRMEVKQKECSIYEAEDELVEKWFQLNRYQYGDISIQFGLAITGNRVNLYLIKFTSKCEQDCGEENCFHEKVPKTNLDGLIHLRRYYLAETADRIALSLNLMVLSEISYQLNKKFPPLDEFFKFNHPDIGNSDGNGYEVIRFNHYWNMVQKQNRDGYKTTSRKLLEQFYKLISFDHESQIGSRRPITDTVRVANLNPSNLRFKVWLEPIGYTNEATMDRIGSSLREFKKAIICIMEATLSMHINGFVHRNISWDNITYDYRRDTYLLLDFEHIGKVCQSFCQDLNHKGFNCSPSILDAALIIKLFDDPKIQFCEYEEYSKFAACLFLNVKTCEKDEEDEKNLGYVRLPTRKYLKFKKNNSFETAKQFCKEYEEGEKSQNQNEKIEKIRELFWKFYNENINEFKPNLSQEDIQKRKMDSSF